MSKNAENIGVFDGRFSTFSTDGAVENFFRVFSFSTFCTLDKKYEVLKNTNFVIQRMQHAVL